MKLWSSGNHGMGSAVVALMFARLLVVFSLALVCFLCVLTCRIVVWLCFVLFCVSYHLGVLMLLYSWPRTLFERSLSLPKGSFEPWWFVWVAHVLQETCCNTRLHALVLFSLALWVQLMAMAGSFFDGSNPSSQSKLVVVVVVVVSCTLLLLFPLFVFALLICLFVFSSGANGFDVLLL